MWAFPCSEEYMDTSKLHWKATRGPTQTKLYLLQVVSGIKHVTMIHVMTCASTCYGFKTWKRFTQSKDSGKWSIPQISTAPENPGRSTFYLKSLSSASIFQAVLCLAKPYGCHCSNLVVRHWVWKHSPGQKTQATVSPEKVDKVPEHVWMLFADLSAMGRLAGSDPPVIFIRQPRV